jgi:ATP-dependent DNA helicase DinG
MQVSNPAEPAHEGPLTGTTQAATQSAQALAVFDQVVQAAHGLKPRAGQRRMAERVAETFASTALGKVEPGTDKGILLIEAGTGVGKSLAYSAPAIALALAGKSRVIISTATVALQEQLVNKDLPLLSQAMPQPFSFALAKGRGRYVCSYKLKQRLSADDSDSGLSADLFVTEGESDGALTANSNVNANANAKAQPLHYLEKAYFQLMTDLTERRWDGDRDSLETPPSSELWSPIAAEASSCTARHCPDFSGCAYFEQRRALATADVIVANHDLLLSTLSGNTLPDLGDCYLILDEAHHLPSVALNHFQESTNLSRLRWVEQLALRAQRAEAALDLVETPDFSALGAGLREHLSAAAQWAMGFYRPLGLTEEETELLPVGPLPGDLAALVADIDTEAAAFIKGLQSVSQALRTRLKDEPQQTAFWSKHYVELGVLAPRLEAVSAWAQLMLSGSQPNALSNPHASDAPDSAPVAAARASVARWFSFGKLSEGQTLYANITAHASPIQPAASLNAKLWPQTRAVLLTSATLTSLGSFDYFLRETGLHFQQKVASERVSSPFDFEAQGSFTAVLLGVDPKHAALYNQAMCQALMKDLEAVGQGALVLFTSRDQMRQAVSSLPAKLQTRVLVQNDYPRTMLLNRHRERVALGQPSIIFGMQSFGEGLDLPGALCEHLFITKLPFAPPNDPLSSARSDWLRAQGRDSFNEWVIPAVSLRLAQWVGRAIRSESDRAQVICYDPRLLTTGYGKRLMQGLPPFKKWQRDAQGQLKALTF